MGVLILLKISYVLFFSAYLKTDLLYNTVISFYFKKYFSQFPNYLKKKWKLQNCYLYSHIIQLIITSVFLISSLYELGSSYLSIFISFHILLELFSPTVWHYLQDIIVLIDFFLYIITFSHIVPSSWNTPFFTSADEILRYMI